MRRNSYQLSAISYQQKVFLFAAFGLLLIAVTGCAKKEIKNIDSKGINIICFGDSVTFGYGAVPGEDYPSALAKMVDLPVINSGIDGDTSSEALKRLKVDVLSRNPLLVIIEFGGNDFLRKIPHELTLNNIREMVEKSQAKGAMVALVDISAGILMSEYRKSFLRLSEEKGAIFIPRVFSGIITNSKFKSDFIHPNAEGYKLIANRIFQAIKPHLEKNALLRQDRK